MSKRSIEAIIAPGEPHYVGDGFRVVNFIPGSSKTSMKRMDPFLVLDYGPKHYFPKTDVAKGVGVHPHKGFETVTIAYHGSVAHADSSGNGGVIHPGDVQWMTAGSGILHKEFHDKSFYEVGGDFQMVQLWVNLSQANKVEKPKYQSIDKQSIAKYNSPDGLSDVSIIAGEFNNIKGPAETYSPVNLFNVNLRTGAKITIELPQHHNAYALCIEGNIIANGETSLKQDHFMLFRNDGHSIDLSCHDGNAVILIGSGEPLNEPIVAQGPFVMNTKQEIIDAIIEFQDGKFGEL